MTVQTKLKLDQWGDLTVERTQDVQPILDRNAQLRGERQKSDWGRHVASIPNVIMERWLNEELSRGNTTVKLFGPEMDKIVARKLKDPDWRWLRTDK
jgi:hypothetical protein